MVRWGVATGRWGVAMAKCRSGNGEMKGKFTDIKAFDKKLRH